MVTNNLKARTTSVTQNVCISKYFEFRSQLCCYATNNGTTDSPTDKPTTNPHQGTTENAVTVRPHGIIPHKGSGLSTVSIILIMYVKIYFLYKCMLSQLG